MSNPHGQANKMPKTDPKNFRKKAGNAGRGRNPFFPQGNAPRPQGNAPRPQGNAPRPQGNAPGPQGNAPRPQGKKFHPQGNKFFPQKNKFHPQGNKFYSKGNKFHPQGNKFPPQGKKFHPQGKQARSKLNPPGNPPKPHPSGLNRRERKSMISSIVQDLPPEVRKEFQQYPPVVQLLARIAMGSSSGQSNEALQHLGIQGLPGEDYKALADKFRPLISKLVESATVSVLGNGLGPPTVAEPQYDPQPGPSKPDFGVDGGFHEEEYSSPAALADGQYDQNYNFPAVNAPVEMESYPSVFTEQTAFPNTENIAVPPPSFAANSHPDPSNLAPNFNFSFTVPPPVIIQNTAYAGVPNFYRETNSAQGNYALPTDETEQMYQMQVDVREDQDESYDPTSPTSSQHLGSDMSEQDMLLSSPGRSGESPCRFDPAEDGGQAADCNETQELSEEDRLYREFFNFMSTKGRAGTDLADRGRDQRPSPSPDRNPRSLDCSQQEYDRSQNSSLADRSGVSSNSRRQALPDQSRPLPDHNQRLADRSRRSPHRTFGAFDIGRGSPDRRFSEPDRESPDDGRKLPDHSRRSPENRLLNRKQKSPDRSRASLENSDRMSEDRHRKLPDRSRQSPDRSRGPLDNSRVPQDRSRKLPDRCVRSSSRNRDSPHSRGNRISEDRSRKSPDRSRRSPDRSRKSPDRSRRSPDRSRKSPDRSRLSLENSRILQDRNRKLPDRSRQSPVSGPLAQKRKLTNNVGGPPGSADRARKSPDRARKSLDRSRKSPDRSRRSADRGQDPLAACFWRISVTEATSGRRLSRSEGEMIEAALLKRITAKDDVKCHGVYRESGALVFVSDDEKSARWVAKTVPFLLPWAGASLKAEPWAKRSSSTELLFELPTTLTRMTWGALCDKIQQQNSGLLTSEWKLIVDDETTRVCVVDRASLENLKRRHFKAFVGFSQVEFKPISEGKSWGL